MKRIFCLLAVSLALPVAGSCADVVSLNHSKIRLSVAPGQTTTGTIDVENTSGEPKSVKVYLEDWYYIPPFDGAKEFLVAGGNKYSCADWITFNPPELNMGPYAKQKISYTVKVPENAQGGRYAVMFFENGITNPTAGAGVGVNVSLRLACLFYVEAEGTLKTVADFDKFSVKNEKHQLAIAVDITNKGNADMTCLGTFNMMDPKGLVVARGEMSGVYTFPGDSGTAKGTWSLPLEKGTYDLVLTFDLGKAREEAGLGRGPVVVKEAKVEIGDNGEVVNVGSLK